VILHMQSANECSDGFSRCLAEDYLSILNNGRLDSLKVEFIFESRDLRWIANFSKSFDSAWKLQNNSCSNIQIKNIYLSLPVVNPVNRDFWINILNSQNATKTLYVNLGDVNWCLYKQIVQNNTKSLTKIFLSQICTSYYNDSEPFDFQIFEGCVFLKVLGVSCESVRASRYSFKQNVFTNVVNFDKLPHRSLEGVLFTFLNFTLLNLETIDSYVWGTSIKRGILMNCAIEGVPIPTRVLKKFEIDTTCHGFYPLLGKALKNDHIYSYHEPESDGTVYESLSNCVDVMSNLLVPVAFSALLAIL